LHFLVFFYPKEPKNIQKTHGIFNQILAVGHIEHEYVALRFIAQESYEKAAPMRIAPTPDVVTPVFMLFHRIAAGDLGLWELASAQAAEADRVTWGDMVGVDAAQAADSGLFRVLEWGGMEVH